MIEIVAPAIEGARIRVVGVGGGGCNAINNMVNRGISGVDLISINTDKQALSHTLAPQVIQIGKETTGGKGAGSIPEIGKQSAEESIAEIKETLKNSDMVFVTCGMGGGTGTGASPVVAKAGKELGALVVGIVTTPFQWEGPKRLDFAKTGIEDLRKHIDALIVIPNQKLIESTDKNIRFSEAYKKVDDILYNATRGIADIITNHGYINVDFADVKTVMKGMGDALMGIGVAKGENRAVEATENALNSPLLDGISIKGAQAALVNVTGGLDLGLHEVDEVLSTISRIAGKNVNIIHGVVIREEEMDEIMVTVVATGFTKQEDIKAEKEFYKPSAPNTIKVQLPLDKEYLQPTNKLFPSGFEKMRTVVAAPPVVNKNNGNGNTAIPVQHEEKILQSPKGEELSKYDTPAFLRNGSKYSTGLNTGSTSLNSFPNLKQGSNYSMNMKNAQSKEEHNDLVIETMEQPAEKPAFLRKIMD